MTPKTAILLACLSLAGCAGTCKESSLRDAKEFQAQGNEVRIQVYEVLVAPPGYHSHAQAQVKIAGKWLWIDGGQTWETPSKIQKRLNTCFTIEEFQSLTTKGGTFEWQENCGEKWREESWIDSVPPWVWAVLFILI